MSHEQQQSLLTSPIQNGDHSKYASMEDSELGGGSSSSDDEEEEQVLRNTLPILTIAAILSTAFSYGCIMTTLFLITLPVECERIHSGHPTIPKSVALGAFVTIAGVTQLISPLIGRFSDLYVPPARHSLGQRMPYLTFGAICTVTGLLGQMFASYAAFWIRYGFAFFLHMIGLNIMYAMMIALIPDQVPSHQTGTANGILALLLVSGSIFGFGLFHTVLSQDIQSMYGLYTVIVIVSSIVTGTHAHDTDAALADLRKKKQRFFQQKRTRQNQQFTHEQQQVDSSCTTAVLKQRTWHKIARHAKKIVIITPAIVLKSMWDPVLYQDASTLFRTCFSLPVAHHDFLVVTISRFFYYCGMSVQTFFLYYLHDVIGIRDQAEQTLASLAILGQVSAAMTCLPVGWCSDACCGGARCRTPFIYLACMILCGATISLVFTRTLHEMIIVCSILGGANGMYLTMETSLAIDSLPSKENATDEDCEGDEETNSQNSKNHSGSAQLLGIWGVAAFLGSAFGPMMGGPLLYAFGYIETAPDSDLEEYSITGYTVVLGVSALYFACSALSLTFLGKRRPPT